MVNDTLLLMDEIPACDYCEAMGLKNNPALIDGKTVHGPWANMCLTHYAIHGKGLGLGQGQLLLLDA